MSVRSNKGYDDKTCSIIEKFVQSLSNNQIVVIFIPAYLKILIDCELQGFNCFSRDMSLEMSLRTLR